MKSSTALSLVGALCLGGIIGFAGARSRSEALRVEGTAGGEDGAAAKARAGEAGETGRLVGADPLETIHEEPVRSRRLVALDRYCAGLDLAAVRRAIEWAPADGSAKNREARECVIRRWAALDPAGAAAFAVQKRNAQSTATDLLDVLQVWAFQDPAAAAQFAASMKEKEVLDTIIYDFSIALAQQGFEATIQAAEAFSAAQSKQIIWGAFWFEGDRDPVAAIARAHAMLEGKLRTQAIAASAAIWLTNDPEAAMAWIVPHGDLRLEYGMSLLEDSLQRWAGQNPVAVARFIETLPPERRNEQVIFLASSWGFRDPASALAWVKGLPESPTRKEALDRVVGYWTVNDPPAAAAFVATQPADAIGEETLTRIGENWAVSDPEGALKWVAGLQNPALEKRLAPSVLGRLAVDDPEAAVESLASLRDAEGRASAVTAIARSWAQSDALAAAGWVLDLPEQEGSRAALKAVVEIGTRRDPTAMAQWLEGLAGDALHDFAVETFARQAQSYDPQTAAEWAKTIADADTRNSLVRSIVRNYGSYDAAGARAWVQAQQFTDAERRALLEQIDKANKRL